MRTFLLLPLIFCLTSLPAAAQTVPLQAVLGRLILDPDQTKLEVQVYSASRVQLLPAFQNVAEWERYASQIREQVLRQVVFRGEGPQWRDAPTAVEWLETIHGGPGYRIKKLRYEAIPGLWIPALLYEPERLSSKVPVILNVNGHGEKGKSAEFTQMLCINLAKRGMLALNVEWFGTGQLATDNFNHYRANQLDLCGTSGLSLHYLYLSRAIDLLVSLDHADPQRLAVTGLSGGGWQTIFISSLDLRVRLANPVAGYSSYMTRTQFPNLDLGDSEQTPTDLAKITDYTHLTAMMAPRPTLLTYNSKETCCFRADYAVGPLVAAARPFFQLYGKPGNLRYHINYDPGHNYGRNNREAFYRILGDYFYPDDPSYNAKEIACDNEVQTEEQLHVPLPSNYADFHSLAMMLSKSLPRNPILPNDTASAVKWQKARRTELSQLVRFQQYSVEPEKIASDSKEDLKVNYWKLTLNGIWTVPAVELLRGEPRSTVILVSELGRSSAAAQVERLLAEGKRVVALDPFYFGESKIRSEIDFLFAILLSALGDRPLGIQASQLIAVARWLQEQQHFGPVTLVGLGPRVSLVSLVAASLEAGAIAGLELHGTFGSLKEVIEQNLRVDEKPELFCFGLLEAFDIKQLMALLAPRPAPVVNPTDRAKLELGELKQFYSVFSSGFDPLEGN